MNDGQPGEAGRNLVTRVQLNFSSDRIIWTFLISTKMATTPHSNKSTTNFAYFASSSVLMPCHENKYHASCRFMHLCVGLGTAISVHSHYHVNTNALCSEGDQCQCHKSHLINIPTSGQHPAMVIHGQLMRLMGHVTLQYYCWQKARIWHLEYSSTWVIVTCNCSPDDIMSHSLVTVSAWWQGSSERSPVMCCRHSDVMSSAHMTLCQWWSENYENYPWWCEHGGDRHIRVIMPMIGSHHTSDTHEPIGVISAPPQSQYVGEANLYLRKILQVKS